MWIEFDPKKDASNVAKHGVSLAPHAGVLYFVAFVERADAKRIISLRRANRRESRHYVQVA